MKPFRSRTGTALLVAGALSVGALLPKVSQAGGFALNEQSVSGLGTAYAGGAASAEDVSTLFFNPAGIALLNQGEFQAAAHGILPSGTFTNQGSHLVAPGTPFNGEPITGGNGGEGGVDNALPQIYFFPPRVPTPPNCDLSLWCCFLLSC